jgi:hypothetical protein
LREKSELATYPHAKFVKDCLEEGIDVPRDLAINLLEEKISEGYAKGIKCSLVRGFPKSTQDLTEFEEKVGSCGLG